MTPQAFRATRKALGLTQQQLADALDLSKATIEQYERGTRGGADPRPVAIPKTVRLALAALKAGIADDHGEGAATGTGTERPA